MHIILHIGRHKTATSSLQAYGLAHADFLNRQGIYWPTEIEGVQEQAKNKLVAIIRADLADGTTRLRDQIERWRTEAQTLRLDTMLLSGEELSVLTDEERQLLVDVLSQDQVDVYLVLRNLAEFAVSFANQEAKWGHMVFNRPGMVLRMPQALRVDGLITDWEHDFGADRVHVGFYDRQKDNIVFDYLTWFGIDMADAPPLEKTKNISAPSYVLMSAVWMGLIETIDDGYRLQRICRNGPKPKHAYAPGDLLLSRTMGMANSDTAHHPKVTAFKDALLAPLDVDMSQQAAEEREAYLLTTLEAFRADKGSVSSGTGGGKRKGPLGMIKGWFKRQ